MLLLLKAWNHSKQKLAPCSKKDKNLMKFFGSMFPTKSRLRLSLASDDNHEGALYAMSCSHALIFNKWIDGETFNRTASIDKLRQSIVHSICKKCLSMFPYSLYVNLDKAEDYDGGFIPTFDKATNFEIENDNEYDFSYKKPFFDKGDMVYVFLGSKREGQAACWAIISVPLLLFLSNSVPGAEWCSLVILSVGFILHFNILIHRFFATS